MPPERHAPFAPTGAGGFLHSFRRYGQSMVIQLYHSAIWMQSDDMVVIWGLQGMHTGISCLYTTQIYTVYTSIPFSLQQSMCKWSWKEDKPSRRPQQILLARLLETENARAQREVLGLQATLSYRLKKLRKILCREDLIWLDPAMDCWVADH